MNNDSNRSNPNKSADSCSTSDKASWGASDKKSADSKPGQEKKSSSGSSSNASSSTR